MQRLKHLLFFPLIFMFVLPGCGGGGGGGSDDGGNPGPSATSVSGVVADGYLVGATVFSDRNGNKKWDDGEPKATTSAGGRYTLEGEGVDQYPIVVLVEASVIDEDTNAEVGKKYILTAPAGKPDFVSPLTTMVQQQVERNPVLSDEEAEKVVKARLGASEEVSLFEDYVAGKGANAEYDTVHKVARVVASTLGNMQLQVEAAAETAGYTPEEVLDALVDIVVQRVMEKLSAIAISVDESGESFDPEVIAGQVGSDIDSEDPVSPDTIDEEIEQAETPVVVSSFQALLESGGSHWFWYDDDGSWRLLEYGIVTLQNDGELAEEQYEYDFASNEWAIPFNDGDYVLTGEGWAWSDDGAASGIIAFNADGSAVWTSKVDGARSRITATEVDLAGKKMSTFAGRAGALLADPDAVFPAGAKAWKMTFAELDDSYEVKIWKDAENGTDYNYVRYYDSSGETIIASLDEMRTAYAEGSDRYHRLEDVELQFGSDGLVHVFTRDTHILTETGTWSETTINGQNAMMLHLSDMLRLRIDIEGVPFFIEWEGGLVKQGAYYAEGSIDYDEGEYDFNKVAFDAIMANLNLAGDGDSEPAPAIDGPRNLAAFFYGSTNDGLNVFAESVTGASDYILYESTDGINYQEVDLSPTYSSDTGVIFDHYASKDVWLKMTAVVEENESQASNIVFVEHDGRTSIDDIITLNTPAAEGQVLSPDSPFEWSAVPGAQSYFVLVEANGTEDSALAQIAGTSWQYGDTSNLIAGYFLPSLVEGASYGIAVGAIDANGTVIGTSPNIDFVVSDGIDGLAAHMFAGKSFALYFSETQSEIALLSFAADGTFVERGQMAHDPNDIWSEAGQWHIDGEGNLVMDNITGRTGFVRTLTLVEDAANALVLDFSESEGESGQVSFQKTVAFDNMVTPVTYVVEDGTQLILNSDYSGSFVYPDSEPSKEFTWRISSDGSLVPERADGWYDVVYQLTGGNSDQFEIIGFEVNASEGLEGVFRETLVVGEVPSHEIVYSTADLEGVWYMRGLYTQTDGRPDNFGYDIGTFTFDTNGIFSGTMWDENGEAWQEADTGSVNADGTVNLWESMTELTMPTTMNAGKDIMVRNFQDNVGEEYSLGAWVKKADSYATSDLAGTWYVRGLSTQKNGLPDDYGTDIGTFAFNADGSFTGTTDPDGSIWSDSDTASVNADGTVNLWQSQAGLIMPTAMNASKNVMISNFQSDSEYAFDVWVKRGAEYATSDLSGTWRFHGLCTQKNGMPDNFGYDIGTFSFDTAGNFTGTMWDDSGGSWTESDSAMVNADGTVNLWSSLAGLNRSTVMNADKTFMASTYEGDDEYCVDLWVKTMAQ